VLTLVGTDYLALRRDRRAGLRAAVVGAPLIALIWSAQPFDPAVPTDALPAWARNPLISSLVLATLVWWLSAWRLQSVTLFHLGSAALVSTIWQVSRLMQGDVLPTATPSTLFIAEKSVALALFAAAAYLLLIALIRRSRLEALVALTALQPAVVIAGSGRTDMVLVVGNVVLWSLLISFHLGRRWPHLGGVLVTCIALVALNWSHENRADVVWLARASSAALAVVLLLVGYLRPESHYRALAAGILGANVLLVGGRAIATGPYPVATVVVAGSFLLLLGGAGISWHKQALLRHARRGAVPLTEIDTEQNG